jgi:hypothetical protein
MPQRKSVVAEPEIAGKNHYERDLEPGVEYLWCPYGGSKSRPFRDSSYDGTDFRPAMIKPRMIKPRMIKVVEAMGLYFRGCRRTTGALAMALFRFRSLGVLVALAVLLSACGIFSKKRQPPCPRVSVLKDAQRLVTFKPGGGNDLSAMLHEVRLMGVRSKCSYSSDEVEVDMALTIVARRGPADTTRKAPARYFVAIMDPRGRVIAKRIFDVTLVFPVNIDSGGLTDNLVQRIPIAKGKSAARHRIIAGLQLTPEELKMSRRRPKVNLPGSLRNVPIVPSAGKPTASEPEYPPKVRGSGGRTPGDPY